jgi:hypothetical protein
MLRTMMEVVASERELQRRALERRLDQWVAVMGLSDLLGVDLMRWWCKPGESGNDFSWR